MFTRDRIRNWLTALGCLALFLALQPYFFVRSGVTADAAMTEHLQQHPADMPVTEEYRFGWAQSPLAHYRSERTLVGQAGGFTAMRQAEMTIGWLSWSSLTLAIGVGLFWAARRLRPAPA